MLLLPLLLLLLLLLLLPEWGMYTHELEVLSLLTVLSPTYTVS